MPVHWQVSKNTKRQMPNAAKLGSQVERNVSFKHILLGIGPPGRSPFRCSFPTDLRALFKVAKVSGAFIRLGNERLSPR